MGRRLRWVVLGIGTAMVIMVAFFVWRSSSTATVGKTYTVTVVVDQCRNPRLDLRAQHWIANGMVPDSWLRGPHKGRFHIDSKDAATFTGDDGGAVSFYNSHGLDNLACGLS